MQKTEIGLSDKLLASSLFFQKSNTHSLELCSNNSVLILILVEVILSMFNKLIHQLPEREPDLKIGPFQLWVSGYSYNQKGQGDFAYLSTPSLLISEDVIVFSAKSDTSVFTFKQFLNDLLDLYTNISITREVEFASDGSEFRVGLTNDLGQISIDIKYYSWSHAGRLEFGERIDQSYLPKIINDLKLILAKKY